MLEPKTLETMNKEAARGFRGVPLGKIICIAEAAWKAYQCETGGGTHCIETLVKDIEACVK